MEGWGPQAPRLGTPAELEPSRAALHCGFREDKHGLSQDKETHLSFCSGCWSFLEMCQRFTRELRVGRGHKMWDACMWMW